MKNHCHFPCPLGGEVRRGKATEGSYVGIETANHNNVPRTLEKIISGEDHMEMTQRLVAVGEESGVPITTLRQGCCNIR